MTYPASQMSLSAEAALLWTASSQLRRHNLPLKVIGDDLLRDLLTGLTESNRAAIRSRAIEAIQHERNAQ